MDLLTIIIPVFNLWDYTRPCLESLAANSGRVPFRVVVADNGSNDPTPAECPALGEALFPGRFDYRRLPENFGFGPACNAGAEGAASEHLLFLNNDTIVSANWLAPLLGAMREDPRTAAYSPLLVYPDGPGAGRVQHMGIAFDPHLHPVHLHHLFPRSHRVVRDQRSLQALSGAALLIRRELFVRAGGFHPEYLNGSEDMDLCCSLRRMGGRLGVATKSLVYHHTSMTPGRYEHTGRNARLLNRRCRGCFGADLHKLALRDGYAIGLNEWLEPHLALAEAAEAPGVPDEVDALVEALTTEPVFAQGYARLVGLLVEAGEKRVGDWAELWARFFPGLRSYEAAVATAPDELSRVKAAERLAAARARLAEPEKLVTRAREMLAWCAERGETELERVYRDWLAASART